MAQLRATLHELRAEHITSRDLQSSLEVRRNDAKTRRDAAQVELDNLDKEIEDASEAAFTIEAKMAKLTCELRSRRSSGNLAETLISAPASPVALRPPAPVHFKSALARSAPTSPVRSPGAEGSTAFELRMQQECQALLRFSPESKEEKESRKQDQIARTSPQATRAGSPHRRLREARIKVNARRLSPSPQQPRRG